MKNECVKEIEGKKMLTLRALIGAVDKTIEQMKKICGGTNHSTCDTYGFAWIEFEKSKNKALFNLFEKCSSKDFDADRKILYHLTRSEMPLADYATDDPTKCVFFPGLYETESSIKWKQSKCQIHFDFTDSDGKVWSAQSLRYKEEVYQFLVDQLGIEASVESLLN